MDGASHIRRASSGVLESGERAGGAGDARRAERQARWSAWMAAAQDGDAGRYEELLREVRPVLHAFLRKRMSNDEAVEDVVQTVLLLIHRARHSYRAERPFEPWLFAVAKNALLDFQRRGARRGRRETPFTGDTPSSAGGAAAPPGASPESRVLSRDLERAVAALPASQREAVWLLHGEGLSVGEAALRVGTTEGALKARVHRAYRALRSILARDGS